ncbi:MAG: DegV family protein, partial [Peptostreptococcaceae bacterium]
DGSCDLPKEIIERYNIEVVGINVSFGDESFVGGVDIDSETFYKRMKVEKELPKTSCPSPERFINTFKGDEDVLLITITSELSGTYSAAVLAKNMHDDEGGSNRVEVIDSRSGSIGQAVLIIKAAEMIEEGMTLDEIVKTLNKIIKDEYVFYGTLETLENAIKGGRINPIAGKIINALNFKAIIQITEGVVKPIDKARGVNNSLKKVLDYVDKNLNNPEEKTLIVGHANCPEKAGKMKETLEERYNFKQSLISEIGPVMGTYTAEGAILVTVL